MPEVNDNKIFVPGLRDHTSLLNYIAEKINAQSYLEVGTFNIDHNFNKIRVDKKVCVDPDPNAKATVLATSDEYFNLFADKYDLVLIDGLHHSDQVKNDVLNAWEVLNQGGVILMHDTNPHSESITHVPRSTREWCGDCYKVACVIDQVEKFTVDIDYGCTILRKNSDAPFIEVYSMDWGYFNMNRKRLLNLVSVEEAIQIINSWK